MAVINSMSLRGKITLAACGLGFFIAVALIFKMATAPSYATVMSAIDPTKGAEINSALSAAGVTGNLTAGGTQQKIIVLGGLAEVSDKGLTVLADVATSLQDLNREVFADQIADMEAQLAEKDGSELDRAIERLDHFKSIQNQLNATALH